ncbi:hypothetical protein OHW58_18100 [Acinetobacter baumannii]|uniref:hypothetical protein n=1 Tax=Acinetobacter baumannii TaxID=470 RepID=UPI000810AF88|nr:hypothetical protein [Acinetobacter baumannii]MDC4397444.1 hypothetical protein [Acinetobacter baumannii]MDC4812037.1 hypothetical protein [Acinetobacter baumannii]MDC4869132.1 hypothetical protein [Acinetobacter baumannii]MDC5156295.1 hypothetical protein [Acinetobacter baumannii]MDC5206037.1 hypothetical protein [Acinetobacter baumannii]
MPHSRLTLPLVSVGLFILSGCTGEDGGFNVGVTLGGTGTGEMTVGTENPVTNPRPNPGSNQMEDDGEYAVAYPNPVTQYCGGVERTIQFVRHYAPFIPMKMGDRMDLLGINSGLKVRYKLQVIVKNTISEPIYEYINSCKAAIQLTGSKTEKKSETNYCLNDETVNTYQPNESKTYYYTFNLPNILQNWTASYNTQYSNQLYASPYEEDNLSSRTQCDALSTILLMDEYPSSKDGAPPQTSEPKSGSNSSEGNSNNDDTTTEEPPIFGGFDL